MDLHPGAGDSEGDYVGITGGDDLEGICLDDEVARGAAVVLLEAGDVAVYVQLDAILGLKTVDGRSVGRKGRGVTRDRGAEGRYAA